jgi:hypothetical protein
MPLRYLPLRAGCRLMYNMMAALTPYVHPISPGKRVSSCIARNCSSENWLTSTNSRSLSGIQPNGSYRFCIFTAARIDLWSSKVALTHTLLRAADGDALQDVRITANPIRNLLELANYLRIGAMR